MSTVLLDDEQKRRINEAITQAEKGTSGEIVPMVVVRSDDYLGARWRAAIGMALLFALGLYGVFPGIDPFWLIAAQIPALGLGYLLGSWRPIQRILLSEAEMALEVHQRALQAFFNENLHVTRDRTGILILVSLLEHRVEILADSGIHSKVGQDAWTALVRDLLGKIKSGHLADGLRDAVLHCGEILSRHFPRRSDDLNEHPDRLVTE